MSDKRKRQARIEATKSGNEFSISNTKLDPIPVSMTKLEQLQQIGIHRVGTKERGFQVASERDLEKVSGADLKRIRELKIPPAPGTTFGSTPQRSAAVQAIGRDAAGRLQYLYHANHTPARSQEIQASN